MAECLTSSYTLGGCSKDCINPGPRILTVRMNHELYGMVQQPPPNYDCVSGYYTNSIYVGEFIETGRMAPTCTSMKPTRWKWFHAETDISDGEYKYQRWYTDCDLGPQSVQTTQSANYATSIYQATSDQYPSTDCIANDCDHWEVQWGVQVPPITWYKTTHYYTTTQDYDDGAAYDYLMAFSFDTMPTGSDSYYNVDVMDLYMDCAGNVTTSSMIEASHFFNSNSLSPPAWLNGATKLGGYDEDTMWGRHVKSAFKAQGVQCHLYRTETIEETTLKDCIEILNFPTASGVVLKPRVKYSWRPSSSYDNHYFYGPHLWSGTPCCTGSA